MAANHDQHQQQARTVILATPPHLTSIRPNLEPGVVTTTTNTGPGVASADGIATPLPAEQLQHYASSPQHRILEPESGANSRSSPALLNLAPGPPRPVFRTPQIAAQSQSLLQTSSSHAQFGIANSPLLSCAQSPEYLTASPQLQTAATFALHSAPESSPSPSVASVHSVHTVHSIHSVQSPVQTHSRHNSYPQQSGFASQPQSPNTNQYNYQDLAAPHILPTTYHVNSPEDKQRRQFAGFVNSPPQVIDTGTSPALGASTNVISPISPYQVDELGRPHSTSFASPGAAGVTLFDFVPLSPSHQRRPSIESVVSSASLMGVMEWQRTMTSEMQQQNMDTSFHLENFATSPMTPLDANVDISSSENIHNTMNISQGLEDDLSPPSQIPPWNGLKTKAGKDRKRLPLACSACRRKKIRCSGQKPSCSHCLRAKQPCVYKVNTRKAAPRTDYMAMLDKRLKRMEERFIRLIPKGETGGGEDGEGHGQQNRVTRAILKPNAQPGAASANKRGRKRAAGEAFGKDVEIGMDGVWRRKRDGDSNGNGFGYDGQDTNEDEDEAHFLQAQITRKQFLDENSLMIDGLQHLPPRDIQIHLAETYFDFVYGQSYPLLHKPTFMRNLVAGTVPPVLVLAVCAISARFSSHPRLRKQTQPNEREQLFLRGEEWAAPAREIALRRHDEPNITILTVYLLLALHEFGTCHGGRSWMFGGMAQRMALMLQLHKDMDRSRTEERNENDEPLNSTDLEIRRRVLWSCFLMDRFISSGSDRPICFPEECISVPLPIREKLFIMEVDGDVNTLDEDQGIQQGSINLSSSSPSNKFGAAAYIVKLVTIWGRLVTYFNLGGRERDTAPMWDLSSNFQSLSQSLTTFEFPPDLRWSNDNLALHKAEKLDNHFIFMHIIFQHLRLFAHRWSLPGHSGAPLPVDMPRRFLEESAAIAIDAAEEVSNLVAEVLVTNAKVTAPFAGYAAYYSSTVHILNLFVKDTAVAEKAKLTLQTNVKFLAKMKRWWGMFHFVGAQLRELYKEHEKTVAAALGNIDSIAAAKENIGKKERRKSGIFQYGDWFDKYPSGVATDGEASQSERGETPPIRPGMDANTARRSDVTDRGVLSGGRQEKDLLSVDEFFVRLENEEHAHTTSESQKKARMAHAMDTNQNIPLLSNQFSPGDARNQQRYMLGNSLAGRMPPTPIKGMGLGMGNSGPTSNPTQSILSAGQGTFFPSSPLETSSPVPPGDTIGLDDPWGVFQPHSARPVVPFGSMLAHAAADWFVPWNMHPPTSAGMGISPQATSSQLPQGNGMVGMQQHQASMGQMPVTGGFQDTMAGIWSPVTGQGDWDGWLAQ